jgi:peptidoglycan/LPS O-acetylase OafA/YrhL
MKKLDYIDALRGLAVLGVLIVHTNQYGHSNLPWVIEKVVMKGASGVQLFFIASAFTLFLSYKSRINNEASPVRNFFIRRFFRIAPMYYIGMLYYLLQDGTGPRYWLGDEPGITASNVLANGLFLHGFNPYWISSVVPGGWSIAIEMMFYACLPFLFSRINNSRQAFALFVISLLVRALLQVILVENPLISHEKLWEEYLVFYFPSQVPIFSLGILMYFIVSETEGKNMPSGQILLVSSVVLLALLVNRVHLLLPDFVLLLLPDHILFGIAFLLLGVGLSRFRPTLIVNPVLMYLGKISFSLYMVHFGVLHWLEYAHLTDYFHQPIIDFSIRLGIVLGIAGLLSTLFYRIIELPGQKIGRMVIVRSEKRTSQLIDA